MIFRRSTTQSIRWLIFRFILGSNKINDHDFWIAVAPTSLSSNLNNSNPRPNSSTMLRSGGKSSSVPPAEQRPDRIHGNATDLTVGNRKHRWRRSLLPHLNHFLSVRRSRFKLLMTRKILLVTIDDFDAVSICGGVRASLNCLDWPEHVFPAKHR